jgi:hypothetical protein
VDSDGERIILVECLPSSRREAFWVGDNLRLLQQIPMIPKHRRRFGYAIKRTAPSTVGVVTTGGFRLAELGKKGSDRMRGEVVVLGDVKGDIIACEWGVMRPWVTFCSSQSWGL